MSRSERLLDLIQILRRHRRPVRGGELAGELAVSLRTVYRDIQSLIATGAIRFLRARTADATQSAAAVMPAAAKQNPQLFFDRGDHSPSTVAAVYGKIKNRIETPLKQLAAASQSLGVADHLRPGPGLTDALPRKRGERA